MARSTFVLGGGAVPGVREARKARALLERGIVLHLVVGTSLEALDGVTIAAFL